MEYASQGNSILWGDGGHQDDFVTGYILEIEGSIQPPVLKPDLSLSSVDLRVLNGAGLESAGLSVGESVRFEVSVHNSGATNASGDVLVQIFEDGVPADLSNYDSNAFSIVASGVISESIPVGGSRLVSIPWTVLGSDRVSTFSAVAEFVGNRAASQSGSVLPIAEGSLANNGVGKSVQIGFPAGVYGIDVEPAAWVGLLEGQSFALSGTAVYDWGDNEPVLGALATISVNGVDYTDRTASPSGAWSVVVNGLPATNYVARVEVDDGRLVGSTNLMLSVGSGPQTIDLRVKQVAFERGTYRASGTTGYAVLGSNVVLKALVRNDGKAPSGDFSVSFLDSSDASYSSYSTNLPAFSERWVVAPAGWTATLGSSSLTVVADSGGAVAEGNETNNERSCTVVGSAAKPDLIVSDVSWSPASVKDGDSVTLSATVRNQGGAALPAGSFDVLFRVGGADVATETVALLSDLTNGASVTVQTSWSAVAGAQSFSAEADSGSAIDEDFEDNNVRTESFTVRQALPDLRPFYYLYGREYSWYYRSGLSFSPSKPVEGEAVTVSCDVYNHGTVPIAAGASFNVEFSADSSVFATETVTLLSELAVGAKVQVSSVWNHTTNGAVSFSASVDAAEAITEESESNNTTSRGLVVYPVAAELAAAGLSFSPLQPLPGASVSLTASVRNSGGAAGGAGEVVEFFAGSTNVVDKIGEAALVSDIAEKGGSGSVSVDWSAPGSAGNISVFVRINGTVYSKVLTVTENPAPNLQLFSEDISVSPTLPNRGESVTVMANIRNMEGSTATNFNVRFSFDRDPGQMVELAMVPVASLGVGSNRTVVATSEIVAQNSAYSVKVELLPNGDQGDADEGDNIATSSFLLADTPRADAGGDTNGFVGQTLALDGSGSANASNYVWEIVSAPSNSAAVLVGADTATPTLVPDQAGAYEIQLTVDGTLDTVTLTADWIEWVVESAHGTPVPTLGTNFVAYGTVLSNSVELAVTNGTTLYRCANATNSFVATATNHETVEWNWNTNYWLEAITMGNGSVTGGSTWVAAQSNATFTATPDAGWLFMGWSGDWVADYTHTNATFQMDAPKMLSATFSEDADGDGLLNNNETAIGSNPRMLDTDGDGFDDGFEVGNGYNPTQSDEVLVNYIRANKPSFQLYSEEQLLNVRLDSCLIPVEDGEIAIDLKLEYREDLLTGVWLPLESGRWVSSNGVSQWIDSGVLDKCFYRVIVEE